jgi:hypothetical protein
VVSSVLRPLLKNFLSFLLHIAVRTCRISSCILHYVTYTRTVKYSIDFEAESRGETAQSVHIYGACWCSCMCEVARPRSWCVSELGSIIPTNIRASGLEPFFLSLPFLLAVCMQSLILLLPCMPDGGCGWCLGNGGSATLRYTLT